MESRVSSWRLMSLGAALLLSATAAQAQATRTWVSGVGDDANPCSRTAPCKTFAGAISKTATGGEIDVLDPGGFGAVTITKPISIEADGVIAGVLVSGTNAIIVSVPNATDVVVLRGLTIEGLGTGLDAIKVLTGGTVHVENCYINHFTGFGIDFIPTVANSKLFVKDTIIRDNGAGSSGGGILIQPSGGGSALASLDHTRLENNVLGLRNEDNTQVSVQNSVSSGNAFAGFAVHTAGGPGAALNLESSESTGNGTGVLSGGGAGAAAILSNMRISGNATGLQSNSGGQLISFNNNHVFGNVSNGSFTLTIGPI